jgi:hypothetical protein
MVGTALNRRHVWWIFVSFLVLLCAVVASGALYVSYVTSGFGACRSVILSSMVSPDGARSVVISRKECAATVPYNTQASIAVAGEPFSIEKNPAFFVITGSPDIITRWRGNDVVEIALIPGGGKISRNEEKVGDIRIEYK